MGFGDQNKPAAKGPSFGGGPSVAPASDDASMRGAFRTIAPPPVGPQAVQPKPADPQPKKSGGKGGLIAAVAIGLVAALAVGAVLMSSPSVAPAPQPVPVLQANPAPQPITPSQIRSPQIGVTGAIREESRTGGPLLGFWAQSASFTSSEQVIGETGDSLTNQTSTRTGWQVVGITHANAAIARLGIRLGDVMLVYKAGTLPAVELNNTNSDAIVRCHAQTNPLDPVTITYYRPGVGIQTTTGQLGYLSSAADLVPGAVP